MKRFLEVKSARGVGNPSRTPACTTSCLLFNFASETSCLLTRMFVYVYTLSFPEKFILISKSTLYVEDENSKVRENFILYTRSNINMNIRDARMQHKHVLQTTNIYFASRKIQLSLQTEGWKCFILKTQLSTALRE